MPSKYKNHQCMGTAMREATAAAPARRHGGWVSVPAPVDEHANRTPRCRRGSAPLLLTYLLRLCAAPIPRQAAHCNGRGRSRRALLVARRNAADGSRHGGDVTWAGGAERSLAAAEAGRARVARERS
jgi:hypothetical protein